jgi:hypothetical protein
MKAKYDRKTKTVVIVRQNGDFEYSQRCSSVTEAKKIAAKYGAAFAEGSA